MISEINTSEIFFVTFIDLLGFSNMVKTDLEAPDGKEQYVNKLMRVHQNTRQLEDGAMKLHMIQFSDSIVLATPFNKNNFSAFLKMISQYQFDLFCEGILARGGVAYGRHYYHDGFMYSLGLIEAYKLETRTAKYPRIVVSKDLFSLIYGDGKAEPDLCVMEENDGQLFVDYFMHATAESVHKGLEKVRQEPIVTSDVKEKHQWLLEYCSKKFPADFSRVSRFSELPH